MASHPFVKLIGNSALQEGASPVSQYTEGGPVRLTRERRDSPLASSSTLDVLLSGGVWLRIDQWATALGRRSRLRCGVLHHVANRTVVRFVSARIQSCLTVHAPSLDSSLSHPCFTQRVEAATR